MEFEDVSEKVEWEAWRVAAAFEVQKVTPAWNGVKNHFLGKTPTGVSITWEIDPTNFHWTRIRVLGEEEISTVEWHKHGWHFSPNTNPYLDEILAHALVRLGFEDERVWSELPAFTAHEKMELCLSMPREFWPQKWLAEEDIVG